MCGIAGIYSKGVSYHPKLNPEVLSHRGPDASGTWISDEGKLSLAHTRLSIIDLSEHANQPFHSQDGRHVIVFNGEIYNYQRLSEKLDIAHKQLIFTDTSALESVSQQRIQSDTEILLESYKQWGQDCLDKLQGMFSFAIYDKYERKLFLARDAMGIKPLFYYKGENCFAFASELKALRAVPEIASGLTIDRKSVSLFLHLGYIPFPYTIYREIKKFPQGHFAEVDHNLNIEIRKWWGLEDQVESDIHSHEQSALIGLEEIITDSVKSRLVADVPVGSFLSGGIDSSLVSAIARKHTDKPLKTFTIGFEEQKFDESRYAKKVAESIGSEHYEHILREKDAMELLLDIIPTYDEPFADSSAIPAMLVSRLAREEVKVVLTGDGGDELFHGYGSYTWAERLATRERRAASKILSNPLQRMGNSRFKRIGGLMNTNGQGLRSHIFSQEQYYFSATEIDDMMIDPESIAGFYSDPLLGRKLTSPENQALFDMKYYLPDDLLVKVDRASMKYGLEARVPLLDKEMVKFALNLDSRLKKGEKYLLKEVLFRHLPRSLFTRPKWGFGIPLGKWLEGEMSWLIDRYLSSESTENAGFVKYSNVSKLVSRFRKGEKFLYNRIWALILIHWWYKENIG